MRRPPPEEKTTRSEQPPGPTLFLDKEGRWFHEGVEVTHERTLLLLAKNLRRDPSGGYRVEVGGETASVTVEDAPYVVRSVTMREGTDGDPTDYVLHLNDGTEEVLDPDTLSIGEGNVLYCRVKDGSERARFLRAAYYQICSRIQGDAEGERFWLPRAGKRHEIRQEP